MNIGTSFENIKVAALDWDGTVVDSVPPKLAQNRAIAKEFGKTLRADEVRQERNASVGFPDLMHRLTGSDDMERIMEVVRRDYDNPAYAKREFPFAEEALAEMRGKGYQLAILTNATREIFQLDASSLRLNVKDFDYTQTADEGEFKKPHPRTFEQMCQYFGITAAQLLYVGDEIKDYETTVNAGSAFVGVTTGMSTAEEFATRSIPYAQDIAELAQLLPRHQ